MYQVGKAARPERFQIDVAVAESAFTKGGINGSKWLVAKLLGYPMSSAACRRSYPPFTHESKQHEMPGLVNDLRAVEGKLAQSASC